MTSLLPPFCLLFGVVLPIGLVLMVIRRATRQLAVATAYRQASRQLGLIADTRGVSLHGLLGGRRIWIGDVMLGHGATRHTEVHGFLSLTQPLGLGLRVQPAKRRRDPSALSLGPELDKRIEVFGDDPTRIELVCDARVRDALSGLLESWPQLHISDTNLRVVLSPEPQADRLALLVHALTELASALESARPDVPTPDALVPWLEPWKALAASMGLTFHPALPSVEGEIDGIHVQLSPRRVTQERFTADLLAFMPTGQDTGFRLRPQLEPDGYWSVGQDIQVDDPTFDAAFVIKGYYPDGVRQRLNAQVRGQLIELLAMGPVEVDDTCIHARGISLEPEPLRAALQLAAQTARALGRHDDQA